LPGDHGLHLEVHRKGQEADHRQGRHHGGGKVPLPALTFGLAPGQQIDTCHLVEPPQGQPDGNHQRRGVPGDVLGVIGPSGAGKSTLARLLVGVWPAAVGKVRLDSADVYQWNKDELGPNIGYLPQDIELFGGTISENIARFGEVDAEKVVQAAKHAGVHDMILHMPAGYNTQLGEGGAGLSGGQKQRIGLARALYGDPALIVLDEPNSNLDDVGEKALLTAVTDLRQRGKTIVMITHRPNAIGVTNKLLLLSHGGAQLFGPSAEVLAELEKMNQQHIAQQQKSMAPANEKNIHAARDATKRVVNASTRNRGA